MATDGSTDAGQGAPFQRDAVVLAPEPASVGHARNLVGARLEQLGRADLVEAAELVVSELVTNALLHAVPPLTLRVRGTRRHPRIEVGDHSAVVPETPGEITSGDLEEQALVTHGRGLPLVQSYSALWGVDLSRTGKVMWFEPSPGPFPADRTPLQVSEAISPVEPPSQQEESLGDVFLVNVPVSLLAHVRRHYDELQREIRLVGLQYAEEEWFLPAEVMEQARHPERHRMRARGTEIMAKAITDGVESADIHYQMSLQAVQELAHTVDLLDATDRFCREEQLLTLAFTPCELSLTQWLSAEASAQVERGRTPEPWHPGDLDCSVPETLTLTPEHEHEHERGPR